MAELHVSTLDRFGLALSNALQADLDGITRSLVSPDTLSPEQRTQLAEKLAPNPGPLQELLKYSTNPAIVLGAIMTLKYPVQGTEGYLNTLAMFDPEKGLKPYRLFIDSIAPFTDIFKGTPLPALLNELGVRVHDFQTIGKELNGKAAKAFWDLEGRPVESLDEIRTTIFREQSNGYWDASLENFANKLSEIDSTLGKKAQEIIKRLPRIELTEAEKALNAGLDETYNWVWEKTGPDKVEGIRRTLLRKGRPVNKGGLQYYSRTEKPSIGSFIEHYSPVQLVREERLMPDIQKYHIDNMLKSGMKDFGVRLIGREVGALNASEFDKVFRDFVRTVATPQDLKPGSAEFSDAMKTYFKEFFASQGEAATAKVASGSHYARFNSTMPDPAALRKLGGPFEELADLIDEQDELIMKVLENPQTTRKDFIKTLNNLVWRRRRLDAVGQSQSYVLSRARDYGLSVVPAGTNKTIGEGISQVEALLRQGHHTDPVTTDLVVSPHGPDIVRHSILKDTYLPKILGNDTYSETLIAQKWDSTRLAAAEKLTPKSTLGGLLERMGLGGLRASMAEAVAYSPALGYKQSMSNIAGYLYHATLGAPNFVAPVKNLFQTIITTYPKYGLKHTLTGISQTYENTVKYLALRMEHGLDHVESLQAAFPDMARSAYNIDDTLLEAMDRTQAALAKGTAKAVSIPEKAKRVLMSLFSTSEFWNRSVAAETVKSSAWEAIRNRIETGTPIVDPLTGNTLEIPAKSTMKTVAKNEGLMGHLNRIVSNVIEAGVGETQFGGGILNKPYIMTELPAPATMLSQFSTRYANLFARGGKSFWGRALLGSGAVLALASAFFRESGEKLADEATTFGALPWPREDTPFYPMTLVPPIAQLGGAVAMTAMTGDPEQLQRSLPLLVPGGVGAARLATSMPGISESAGQLLNRSYVDVSQESPDGRYPLKTADGNLIGYYSKMALFARSIGLGDTTSTQEQAMSRWMLGYGPRIAEVKRRYMNALAENDQRGADAAEAEYRKLNPGMGPMPVKKSQLRALHLRQDVSRLEREMETLDPVTRQQFMAVYSVAAAQRGPGFLGIRPEGLTAGNTAASRDPYRLRPSVAITSFGQDSQSLADDTVDNLLR